MLSWKDILEFANHGNLQPTRRVEKTAQEWQKELTEEQYYVTREHGTERNDHFLQKCAACLNRASITVCAVKPCCLIRIPSTIRIQAGLHSLNP